MKTNAERILAAASREIGYREGPGKRNKYGEWYGMDGVAWCMEFVQWVYHTAGMDLPFRTASCGELLNWYRQNRPECITREPVPGCIVIFDFPNTRFMTDHTGIFVACDGYRITTIDGNTSNENEGNGGWVQQRKRTLGFANPTYIVPGCLREEETMDVSKLTGEQCYELLLKANEYAGTLAAPDWMRPELDEAVKAGLTDGTRPLALCMRGAAAIMALRGAKKAAEGRETG